MPHDKWIDANDILTPKDAFCISNTLDVLLSNDMYINCICHGESCDYEGDGCLYIHNDSGILGPQSKVDIRTSYEHYTNLTLEELYYYLNIAYQNYIEDGQYPETIKLFADGLEYFRKACNIKGTVHKEAAQQPQ